MPMSETELLGKLEAASGRASMFTLRRDRDAADLMGEAAKLIRHLLHCLDGARVNHQEEVRRLKVKVDEATERAILLNNDRVDLTNKLRSVTEQRDTLLSGISEARQWGTKPVFSHASDCAVHDGPAFPAGQCTCPSCDELSDMSHLCAELLRENRKLKREMGRLA